MNALPLSRVLKAFAASQSLLPNDTDRTLLVEAAEMLDRQAREPHVVIVGATLGDPVANAVESISEGIENMRDDLHAVRDHVDDVLRLLRKQRNEFVSGDSAPLGTAAAPVAPTPGAAATP